MLLSKGGFFGWRWEELWGVLLKAKTNANKVVERLHHDKKNSVTVTTCTRADRRLQDDPALMGEAKQQQRRQYLSLVDPVVQEALVQDAAPWDPQPLLRTVPDKLSGRHAVRVFGVLLCSSLLSLQEPWSTPFSCGLRWWLPHLQPLPIHLCQIVFICFMITMLPTLFPTKKLKSLHIALSTLLPLCVLLFSFPIKSGSSYILLSPVWSG